MAKPDPITRLESRVQELEHNLETLSAALGIEPWQYLTDAAKILKVTPYWLRCRIARAEERKALKQPVTLEYGVHYRNMGDSRPVWQVNLKEIRRYANLEPSQRYEG